MTIGMAGIVIIVVVVAFVKAVGRLALAGLKVSWPYLLIAAAAASAAVMVINAKRNGPVTYEQAVKLVRNAALRYAKKSCDFQRIGVPIDPRQKTGPEALGRWYDADRPAAGLPSYVSSIISGRRQEWSIVALLDGGVIRRMWVSSVNDPQYPSALCTPQQIADECRSAGAGTVMLVLSHPYIDPLRSGTLMASQADLALSEEYGETLGQQGINFNSFISSGGDLVRIYSSISELFEAPGYTMSDFVDRYGISKEMDRELIREYRRAFRGNAGLWIKGTAAAVLVVMAILALIGMKTGIR